MRSRSCSRSYQRGPAILATVLRALASRSMSFGSERRGVPRDPPTGRTHTIADQAYLTMSSGNLLGAFEHCEEGSAADAEVAANREVVSTVAGFSALASGAGVGFLVGPPVGPPPQPRTSCSGQR